MHPHAALVDRIRELLLEEVSIGVASADTDLIETGTLDSLALVELLHAIEQEFGIEVPLETLEIESFRTVDRIADLVASCLVFARTDAA